jgi:hypothetical protein
MNILKTAILLISSLLSLDVSAYPRGLYLHSFELNIANIQPQYSIEYIEKNGITHITTRLPLNNEDINDLYNPGIGSIFKVEVGYLDATNHFVAFPGCINLQYQMDIKYGALFEVSGTTIENTICEKIGSP